MYIMSSMVERITSNKTTNAFVSENNIDLLWNIIIQNNAFQTSIEARGNDGKQKLRTYYIDKVKTFVETNLTTTSTVVEFNKQFIAFFIRGFQPNSLNDNHIPKPVKLQINNNTPLGKEAITVEEIKSERLSEFDQKYEEVQKNFNLYRTSDTPSNVEFSDKTADEPFEATEFQKHITSRLENRKIDEQIFVESVSTTLQQPVGSNMDVAKWLNLKEVPTSIHSLPSSESTPPLSQQVVIDSQPYADSSNPFTAAIETLQERMTSLEKNVSNLCELIQRYITVDETRNNITHTPVTRPSYSTNEADMHAVDVSTLMTEKNIHPTQDKEEEVFFSSSM